MSELKSRIPKRSGFADARKLPTGPKGFPLCRWCGDETPSKRRTFCSDACVHEWKLTTQPAYQRRHVEKRDACVCQACGVDTKEQHADIMAALRGRLREAGVLPDGATIEWRGSTLFVVQLVPAFQGMTTRQYLHVPPDIMAWLKSTLREHKIPIHRFASGRVWDMDHIVPVAEGGGGCGLDNLRTLCRACHVRVTGELRKRLKGKAKR